MYIMYIMVKEVMQRHSKLFSIWSHLNFPPDGRHFGFQNGYPKNVNCQSFQLYTSTMIYYYIDYPLRLGST